ncbi:hypothetical protein ACV35A_26600, partial [Pseudomonas aeruginosa]
MVRHGVLVHRDVRRSERRVGGLAGQPLLEEIEKKLNSAVFPGAQGGPLMHVIAAKAVCFKEALEPGFKDYQAQVIRDA